MNNNKNENIEVTQKDLRKVFWRSFFIDSTINYERFQSLGFTYAMIPLTKKLYDTKEDRVEALQRHLEMYNSQEHMANPILGVAVAMEEENAKTGKLKSAINNIKVGLMGPFAGIGDSLVFGTLRPILAGLAATFALQGNIFGPIMFLILWNIFNFGFRYWSLMYGYKSGTGIIKNLKARINKISEGASVLGLMVLGTLVASWVSVSTPITYTVGEEMNSLQEVLNSVMPSMLPLIATSIIIFLLRKKVSINKILLGIFVVSFILGGFGILAG